MFHETIEPNTLEKKLLSLLHGGGVDIRGMEGISITPPVLARTMTMVMKMIMMTLAIITLMIMTMARIKRIRMMNHR